MSTTENATYEIANRNKKETQTTAFFNKVSFPEL